MLSERTGALPACPDAAVFVHGVAADGVPGVALVRTSRGWAVVCPAGTEAVDSVVEGMSLADLIGEELGRPPEPDRTARRSARGPGEAGAETEDPRDARIAALERTVAQLEHALAARVSTERAIGVLAEREGTSPRAAFEALRQSARSSGRPVHELAREVLDSLAGAASPEQPTAATVTVVTAVPGAAPWPRAPFPRRVEHTHSRIVDGRS